MIFDRKRKAALTAVLLLLAVLTWIGRAEQAVGFAGYDALQSGAHDYLLDIRGRALAVFVAARTADGLIALIESVQVGPVVAEARPGMVLDPVREVMEHLGNMMGVSVITVEALDILRRVGDRVAFATIFPVGLVIVAIGLWLRRGRVLVLAIGQGILVLGAVLTVGLPLAVCAEKYISKGLLQSEYGVAYQDVSHIKSDLNARLQASDPTAPIPPPLDPTQAPVEGPSLLSRIEAWFSDSFARIKEGTGAIRAVTQQGAMDSISDWLNAKVESALTLMAIFLVEVFVMPSLLGYVLYRWLRSMIVAIFAPR